MNKLSKAIALFSLFALLSVAVCVWEAADSEAAIGTSDEPKYIIGEQNNPYNLVVSDRSVTGTIDFNQTAIGYKTTVGFYIYEKDSDDVGDASYDKVVKNFRVNIAPVQGNDGRYTVTVTACDGAQQAKIIIKLEATTKIDGNETASVSQEYYWAIDVLYDETTRVIKVGDTVGGTSESPSEPLSFSYGATIEMSAGVYSGQDVMTGYRMYAVGLPDGLAMVQGMDENAIVWFIGGRVATSFDASESGDAEFTVYAISDVGDVVTGVFQYTLGGKPEFGFKYELRNESETGMTLPFIVISKDQTLKMEITTDEGTPELTYTVQCNGQTVNRNSDGSYDIKMSGTGTMTVKIIGSYLGNPVATQTFNIYVVSQIFDSDLCPSVTSA